MTVPPLRNGVGSAASLSSDVAARMLVALDQRDGLAAAHFDRHDLAGEAAIRLGAGGLLLARQSEEILIGARNLQSSGEIFGRLGHAVDAVALFHERIDETPADRRVEHLGIARKGLRRLAMHEGRPRHRLDAAGDDHVGLAAADRARADPDRIEARTAETVDRRAGHLLRQAGEQSRHARHIAIVFAGLVGTAGVNLVDGGRRQAGQPGEQSADRMGEKIVGPHAGEHAGVTPDRRANPGTKESLGHRSLTPCFP